MAMMSLKIVILSEASRRAQSKDPYPVWCSYEVRKGILTVHLISNGNSEHFLTDRSRVRR
jgi:hypothetical protein